MLLFEGSRCHEWMRVTYDEIFIIIIFFVVYHHDISHQEDIKSNGKTRKPRQEAEKNIREKNNNNNLKETDFNIYFHDIPFGQFFICLEQTLGVTHVRDDSLSYGCKINITLSYNSTGRRKKSYFCCYYYLSCHTFYVVCCSSRLFFLSWSRSLQRKINKNNLTAKEF